jgi:DNA modification methylase
LLKGDCREQLKLIPDESVDSIVTDPPYELGFMGKSWDASGIAYNVEVWRECLRVLKPGGHLLAFGGSRTYHRLACAVEDAGFEIRDQIMWVYATGFPKSLDVGKAIDKMDAQEMQQQRRFKFTEWVRSTGLTAKQIDKATGTMMGNHYTTHPSQPAIMTTEHLNAVRHLISHVPQWIEKECLQRSVESENYKKRDKIGEQNTTVLAVAPGQGKDRPQTVLDVTAPATDDAKKWDGWGTALKPAHEPVVVARKPLSGTVAQNVLRYGTGAINIDGCRVGDERVTINTFDNGAKPFGGAVGEPFTSRESEGRWPANFIHDGSDEVLELFPETKPEVSAARFFYCAKASKAERNAGLEHLPQQQAGIKNSSGRGFSESDPHREILRHNHHPTVKPIDLMRYLIRLVTPPNGTVLDPFAGSGTTLVAAIHEHMNPIGIELTEEYWAIIEARTDHARNKT